MLDAPWLKTQVETHLFFGFCSRKCPFAIFFIIICFLRLFYQLFALEGSFVARFFENIQIVFFLFIGFFLLKMTKYHQAAIGWWVVKATMFFCCLAVIVAGGLVGGFKGNPDYLYALLIGFIWLPFLEFFPRLTEKQKYLTIGRIVISIPLLILWQQTGTCHWN
jgi:hypothetical protein